MECSLDRMFDDLQFSLSREFPSYLYHVKVSEVRKPFYVLIRKKRLNFMGQKERAI